MCFQIAAQVRQRLRNHPEPAAALPFPTPIRARGCSRTPGPCTAHTRVRSVPSARWPFRTEMRPKGPSGAKAAAGGIRATGPGGRKTPCGGLRRGSEAGNGDGRDRPAERAVRPKRPCRDLLVSIFGYQRYEFFSARCGMFRTFNHIEFDYQQNQSAIAR